MLAVATGIVHPLEGSWKFDGPIQAPFPDGRWEIFVNDSRFHVFIDGKEPADLGTFINEVASIVQGCLDSLGYHLATPLRAEVTSMVIDGNKLVYRTSRWAELLSEQSRNSVAEDELQPYVDAVISEPLARLALADLRTAIESPDDTLYLAYRAVESVRQWFLVGEVDDKPARKASWDRMRSELGIADDGPTRRLEKLAMSRRHGGATPPTGDERTEAMLLARDIVARFVGHLHARTASQA